MNVREIQKEIAKQLGFIQADTNWDWITEHGNDSPQEDSACLDVRLQLQANGSFVVHFGDPSYDTDHRGFWGSSSIAVDSDLEDVAHDLLDQALDDQSQDQAFEPQSNSTINKKGN